MLLGVLRALLPFVLLVLGFVGLVAVLTGHLWGLVMVPVEAAGLWYGDRRIDQIRARAD